MEKERIEALEKAVLVLAHAIEDGRIYGVVKEVASTFTPGSQPISQTEEWKEKFLHAGNVKMGYDLSFMIPTVSEIRIQAINESKNDCYCVCHSPVASQPMCDHCKPAVEIAVMHTTNRMVEQIDNVLESMGMDVAVHGDTAIGFNTAVDTMKQLLDPLLHPTTNPN